MTPLSFRLLRLLADGDFHSGAALARTLDVSRGTVWNAVRALEVADLGVYKVRGRGYKLADAVSLLEASSVARFAGADAARLSIEVADNVASTNSELMKRASVEAPAGSVIAAEWQHGGRGRMGRPWHAGVARGLSFSVLWRYVQGAGALAGLSLAVGVAVVRALRELGAAQVQLKWPNDVLWDGRKLAGILVELQGDALGPSTVVIGIGLNVRLSPAMRARIDQPAADLESACEHTLDRNAVLGVMLRHLVQVLDAFGETGFAPLREEWERYHAHQGLDVMVTLPSGQTDHGIARGIAEDGALLFQSGSAIRRLHSAEISVRAGKPAKARGARAARPRTRA
ncbi:MAG: Bifunctional ligase/repressor BirA [Betaproteobacteria bacterium]|nr:Bifunctional ligase/repressor BirA [Betaproteobacteria bacterium]